MKIKRKFLFIIGIISMSFTLQSEADVLSATHAFIDYGGNIFDPETQESEIFLKSLRAVNKEITPEEAIIYFAVINDCSALLVQQLFAQTAQKEIMLQ